MPPWPAPPWCRGCSRTVMRMGCTAMGCSAKARAGGLAQREGLVGEVEDGPSRRGPPRRASGKAKRIANVRSEIITLEPPSSVAGGGESTGGRGWGER